MQIGVPAETRSHETRVTAFALEAAPSTTRAQRVDVLSSQANIEGNKAVLIIAGSLVGSSGVEGADGHAGREWHRREGRESPRGRTDAGTHERAAR
ncbi:hypothetical protein R69749_07466 [Paraburkholderia domus]|uniref:Uncharacterized protein n=1 Tax=Paraburkholderia domus TaxID=2793075 RepID=A0A9N8R5U7_9BURK|nr:hypothetical protein R70006_08013 [Paraburkholderia domus]CAE6888497.1 hypothetical protein R69749_07466 [Paraburkholderia domus]CAE6964339.1 hypothetical protein R70211_07216 [Paraburkholderia domus]CAE6967103.1 hypothetical protein R70199_07811 [Paraburkholderia domus]